MKIVTAILTAVIASTPAAVGAQTLDRQSFSYNGETYHYTATRQGGVTILRGVVGSSRMPFVLRVAARRVSGSVGANRVSFARSKVTSLSPAPVIASRD